MKLYNLKCINSNINIDDYITNRDMVKINMEYPDWLGDFSREDLCNMLDNNTKICMYYKDSEFVCSMMLIPSTKKDLKKFGLDNLDNEKVVDYGPMFVNSKYVGNGLQYQMLELLDKYSKELGYEYAVSTIHPDNVYSIRNLVKDGFVLVGSREFKRGIRNIYLKELK